MARAKLHKAFDAGDGRVVSKDFFFIHKGEALKITSTGWDCTLDECIEAYYVFHLPENPLCEEGITTLYKETCAIDCCNRIDLSKVKLTKNHQSDIISESGIYFLHRTCGAENVDVFYKKIKC